MMKERIVRVAKFWVLWLLLVSGAVALAMGLNSFKTSARATAEDRLAVSLEQAVRSGGGFIRLVYGRHREDIAVFAFPVSRNGKVGSEVETRVGKAYFDMRLRWKTERLIIENFARGEINGQKYEAILFRQGI